MYAAKKEGKNCWQVYTQEMQSAAYEEMRLTGGLRSALEREELSLCYQPQFLATGSIIGFEALLRWNSPELGAIPPRQFIPQSFVDMITTDIYAAKIIGSIIHMAHTLNIAVVAEGVETKQQLAYLRDHGCDRIQGFIFSKPLPELEAVSFLAGNN
ncbi:MAG: EAL domain-containing protein [Sporomusaceae bacterium]|nr:EAL domain-containing protein [Sporomusaceae bacterium]